MTATAAPQKGSALLMVLVISAIIASIATTMLFQQRSTINQTQAWLTQQQMQRATTYAMPWAVRTLQQPLDATQHMPTQHIDGMQVDATLTDLASSFNLNWLTRAEARPVFARLLLQIQPTLSAEQADIITARIAAHKPTNALQQSTPQAAATKDNSGNWLSTSQVRQVPGLSSTLQHAIEAHSQALPSTQAWNLNSIPTSALTLLWPDLSTSQIQAFERCRAQQPLRKLSDAKACLPDATGWSKRPISTTSEYAQLRITVQYRDQRITLVRDLHHDAKGVQIWRQHDSIETP